MRLLIVEDEKRLADVLAKGLTAEGLAAEVAYDGLDGLHRARAGDYDLIILDIMLPGMNGYRVCSALRTAGIPTPVLMLTAKDGEYDEAEGLDTGADDYLRKPFSYVVLLARVRALLRRGGRERATVLQVGDLVVDPNTHGCRRGIQELPLTVKEFAVLEYLAARAGQVVPKNEILDHVWHNEYDGDANIVEVYISALRRKIDAPFGCRSITTVRGAGYRLTSGHD
ncbi:response regulator transcription factor [Nocardia sp. NPDC005978]|uniref:response regulator transcription factor n=1 Tax=unclassified Nocardia TaxID=2637762 RepID=UPI0033A7F12F